MPGHRSTDASDPISVNGLSKCLLGNLVIPDEPAKNEWRRVAHPLLVFWTRDIVP